MSKIDYHNKLQEMINEGIGNGIYKVTEDKRLCNFNVFKSFLYQNIKKL